MRARQFLVALIVVLAGLGLAALLWRVLAPGGWTPAKVVMFAAFLGTAPWTGLCLANGVIGFVLLMFGPHAPRPASPLAPVPRIAIAMTVRNEDMRRVL